MKGLLNAEERKDLSACRKHCVEVAEQSEDKRTSAYCGSGSADSSTGPQVLKEKVTGRPERNLRPFDVAHATISKLWLLSQRKPGPTQIQKVSTKRSHFPVARDLSVDRSFAIKNSILKQERLEKA
jgi:hypothetical protein